MKTIVRILLWIWKKIIYFHQRLWEYDGTNKAGFKLFFLISFTLLLIPDALVITYLFPHSFERKAFMYNEADKIVDNMKPWVVISKREKHGSAISGILDISGTYTGKQDIKKIQNALISSGWEKIDEGPGEYPNIVKIETYYLSKNYYESDFEVSIIYTGDNKIYFSFEEINHVLKKHYE